MNFNFKEFYQCLDSIFTKRRVDFEINETNFSYYLMNRYISFYDPSICIYINEISNKNGLIDSMNQTECYDYLFNSVPKLPKKRIKYVKKNKTKAIEKLEISDEELLKCADYLEISKREVMDGIYQLKELKIL